MEIFGLNNVHYDCNSEFPFDQLNESLFIEKVFNGLSHQMGSHFNNYDFYVFSCFKSKVHPKSLNENTGNKKILIYLSDESGRDPASYLPYYHAIFKQYIGKTSASRPIFPLQLGYVKGVPGFESKPINERKHNVFFRGNLNSNRINFYRAFSRLKYFLPTRELIHRAEYIWALLKMKNNFSRFFSDSIIIFNHSFKSGYSLDQYGKILSESKIVLCPMGFNRTECFRHYEAMRAGCIVISEKLPDTEFYNNSPIIQINNWDEGLKIVDNLLKDPDRMHKLQTQIINWWNEKCSEKATAEYISGALEELHKVPSKISSYVI